MGLPNHPVYRGGSFHLRLCETSFEKLITLLRHQQGNLGGLMIPSVYRGSGVCRARQPAEEGVETGLGPRHVRE